MAGEPNLLTVRDTDWDGDADRMRTQLEGAVRFELRSLQIERACTAAIGFLEIEIDPCMMVATRATARARTRRAPRGTPKGRSSSKQRGEEVAEPALLLVGLPEAAATCARPPELEAFRPSRRRAELLSGLPIAAELIVGSALLGVLQDLVSLLHLLEFLLGVRLLADVRVEFAREPAVCLLDLVRARRPSHAQDLVVIAVFHGCCTLGARTPQGKSSARARARG